MTCPKLSIISSQLAKALEDNSTFISKTMIVAFVEESKQNITNKESDLDLDDNKL